MGALYPGHEGTDSLLGYGPSGMFPLCRGKDAQLMSGKLGLSSLPRVGEEEVLEKLLETFSQGH